VLQLLQRVRVHGGEATSSESDRQEGRVDHEGEEQSSSGRAEQGISAEQARVWELIQPSPAIVQPAHSACYGLIAYQTAYLKAHHPVSTSALLTSCSSQGREDEVPRRRAEDGLESCPDVNLSQSDSRPTHCVPTVCASVSPASAKSARCRPPNHRGASAGWTFKDFLTLLACRVSAHKRTVESMIKAGGSTRSDEAAADCRGGQIRGDRKTDRPSRAGGNNGDRSSSVSLCASPTGRLPKTSAYGILREGRASADVHAVQPTRLAGVVEQT